jgi:hypothetical protein
MIFIPGFLLLIVIPTLILIIIQLPEEVELVWDDGVAPETCIDFDAPHIDIKDILLGFTAVVGSIVGLYGLIGFMDPAGNSPVAPRSAVIPPNTVNLFFGNDIPDSDGGDADEEEEEEEDDE